MKEDGRREILLLVKGREGGSTGRYDQAGDYLSKTMLAYEYRTCQDKIKGNLEVIGGAGIRREGWNIEIRSQKSERKEPAIGGRSQIHKNKEASQRRSEE